MAEGLKEVLAKYGLNDEAMAEIEEAATPDSFRSQLAELGARAKKADELEARLTSIESAPKRKEALARVGVDYDAEKPYGQKVLDTLPADKLDDADFVATFVKEQGFEANAQVTTETQKSSAERIVEAQTAIARSQGPGQVDPREEMKGKTPDEILAIAGQHGGKVHIPQ